MLLLLLKLELLEIYPDYITNISLKNYAVVSIPTEASAEGTLLYIANLLSYKPHHDLSMFRNSELESTFVEIINPKKSNIVVGIIYRHPSMNVTDFNNYLNALRDFKRSKIHISAR